MTRFDLHPEELLERAGRGTLSTADRRRLELHLAECAVCRVEQALGAQAALDAEPLRDEKLLVARLKRDVARRLNTTPQQRTRRKGALIAVALATGTLASVAAAATLVVMHRAATPQSIVAAAPAPFKAKKSQPAPRGAQPAPPAAALPSAPETSDVTPPSTEPAPKPAVVELTSAAEAFSRANLARRDGKVKEAVRLYRTLQERFAGSSEELVSRVALGRLLLDRLGDSRGALVQFNSYLASPGSGALREEAMVGRALALGRLGRSAEERSAWKALLEAWPKSTHARRAAARLAELDGSASPAQP